MRLGFLAILPDRPDYVSAKITVQSGAQRHREVTRRPKAGALLTVILVGSRLECREDGRFLRGALGGRDGDQPVTGSARGSARAAARRASTGAKAEPPLRLRRVSAGGCARSAERTVRHFARRDALPRRDHAPDCVLGQRGRLSFGLKPRG